MKLSIQRLALSILTCLTLAACSGDSSSIPPEQISLPNAFQHEGISARGEFIWSIPTGAVYRADINTGTGSVLVPPRRGAPPSGSRLTIAGASSLPAGAREWHSYMMPPARIWLPIP